MQKKKKILIVDNDSTYITNLRKGLTQSGYEVIFWSDSKKALEISKDIQPNLIISEIDLPQMSGHEFFYEIKLIPEIKDIPFIFLSNQKRVDDRIKSMELGIDDFITKPFFVEEVIARVESLLEEFSKRENSKQSDEKKFSGKLSEMNLVDLIQTLEVGRKSAIIKLKHYDYEGSVYIRLGDIVDAEFREYNPLDALKKMILWDEGIYWVEISHFEHPKKIKIENKDIINEGLNLISSWEKIKQNLPPLNTVLSINDFSSDLNNVTKDEQQLLESLNGNRQIYEIVLKSPFDDLKALELINKLFEKGHLQAMDEAVSQNDDYISRIKDKSKQYSLNNKRASHLLSNLLKNPVENRKIKVERRKDERRQTVERRKYDRRLGQRIIENKIPLERAELLMIREKLR